MGRTPREAARLAAAATPHGELRTAPRTACPADLPPEGAASAAGCPHHRTGRPPRHRETSDFAPDRRGSNASVISLWRSRHRLKGAGAWVRVRPRRWPPSVFCRVFFRFEEPH